MEEEEFTLPMKFDDWLNEQIETEDGVYTGDLILIMCSLFVRLRTALIYEDHHAVIHQAMEAVEHRLAQGDAMRDAEGRMHNILTAEERLMLDEAVKEAGATEITDEDLWAWIESGENG